MTSGISVVRCFSCDNRWKTKPQYFSTHLSWSFCNLLQRCSVFEWPLKYLISYRRPTFQFRICFQFLFCVSALPPFTAGVQPPLHSRCVERPMESKLITILLRFGWNCLKNTKNFKKELKNYKVQSPVSPVSQCLFVTSFPLRHCKAFNVCLFCCF